MNVDLTHGSIFRGLLRFSLPLMAGNLLQQLYNLVDTFVVGRYCGEIALAAVGSAFSVMILLTSIVTGLCMGSGVVVSQLFGQKDDAGVRKAVGNAFVLIAGVSALLTILSYALLPVMMTLLRIPPEAQGVLSRYLLIVFVGIIPTFLYNFGACMLRAVGNSTAPLVFLLISSLTNVALDFLFVAVLPWGVAGAAVATIIGQLCGCALAIWFNHRKNTDITLSLRGFRPDWRLIGEIYAIGLPSVIMVAIGSVMTFCMNKILIAYHSAKETAATAFGIYFKLNSFIFMPVFGLNNGVVPIVAYNYGAQNRLRMVETIKRSAIYASCIMLVGMAVFWSIPGSLLKIFDATDTMLQVGVPALRIISLSFCMAGACIALGSSFQALGKAVYSMTTSIIRQLVFLVPIAYVLARYGQSIGNDDLVWWSYPLAEIASLFVTLAFFRRLYRTLIAPLPASGGAPVRDDSDDDPIGV